MGARPLPGDPVGGAFGPVTRAALRLRQWAGKAGALHSRTGTAQAIGRAGARLPVHRLQQVAEGARVARGDLARAAHRAERRGLVALARRSAGRGAAGRAPRSRRPRGSGVSSRSLRRAISASPSEAVEKKPPRSGSAKRSISRVGERDRLLEPALLAGRFEQARSAPRAGTRGPRGRRRSSRGRRCRCAAAGRARRASRARRTPRRRSRRLSARRRGLAGSGRSSSSAAPASASAAIISAFQLVRRLSSSAGRRALLARARAAARGSARAASGAGLRPARVQHVQPGLRSCGSSKLPCSLDAEPGDRRVGVRAEHLAQLGDASTRSSGPRRPRSRRRARE